MKSNDALDIASRALHLPSQVITLLFLACLSSPETYLCPEDDEQGTPFITFASIGDEDLLAYGRLYLNENFLGLFLIALL